MAPKTMPSNRAAGPTWEVYVAGEEGRDGGSCIGVGGVGARRLDRGLDRGLDRLR
jgi:hypothetical protein